MSEQEEGARLRFDPIVRPLRFHAQHRAEIVWLHASLKIALLGLDVVQQPFGHFFAVEGLEVQAQVDLALLGVAQVRKVREAADCVGVEIFDPIPLRPKDDDFAVDVHEFLVAMTGKEQGDEGISRDVQETCRQAVMLHAHEPIEAVVVALEFVVVRNEDLLTQPIQLRRRCHAALSATGMA